MEEVEVVLHLPMSGVSEDTNAQEEGGEDYPSLVLDWKLDCFWDCFWDWVLDLVLDWVLNWDLDLVLILEVEEAVLRSSALFSSALSVHIYHRVHYS